MLIHWLHKLIGARCSFKGFEAAVGTLSSDLRNLATRKDTAPTPFPPMEEAWFLGPTFSGLGMAPPKVTLPEPASPPTRSAGRTRTARDAWMQTSSPQSMPPSTTASTSFLSPSVARPCDQQKDLRGESVGNSGPELGKVENVALWLLTVGARTIDREFPAFAIFGEHRLKGESLSDASLPRNKMLPLIHSHDAAAASLYCPSPQDSSSIVLFPKAQPTSTYSQFREMDPQGHVSQPVMGVAATVPYQAYPHLYQQQQQQQLQMFWADQYREIEQTTDFKNHSLPLARIKKIMKADEDVRMIAAEAPVCPGKKERRTLRCHDHLVLRLEINEHSTKKSFIGIEMIKILKTKN
ncbi:hypothetical protein HPP92_027526 [Vanilla planifolia]|uniref:Transcription factor CBF/NF-Y/archaeal histone domain-containing protein n=1 Tax=Vanilla planifolia TaxID=51239 RepID=A0A835PCJ6_VANPL|nr:hypothetical protein HPP92_027526 [Vanilla planifolia]